MKTPDDEREAQEAMRDARMAEIAAGHWFADEMEKCPGCGEYVPWDELVALIGTPPICPGCRKNEQERR